MLRSLWARLSLALALILVGAAVVFVLLSASATGLHQQIVEQRFNMDLAASLVAERALVVDGRFDHDALRATFDHYVQVNPSIEIYLLAHDGRILSHSVEPADVMRTRVALEPVENFLRGAERYPVLGDDPRSFERSKAFSVTPVPSADETEAYLYVILRGKEYEAFDRSLDDHRATRVSAWAAGTSLLAAMLAGLAVFHLLTRRLNRLAALMESFRANGFIDEVQYHGRGDDEIDRLGRSFQELAGRIRTHLGAVKCEDAKRRELIANVSHDLRTPLASLHGYLETLQLNSTELSEKQRASYTGTALRASQRLRRLVEELFELATLEASETKPRYEHFSMPELAHDVAQKFALEAQGRQIRLDVERATSAPLVNADISLVERVLENLIENALAHTSARGHVRVAVRPQGKFVAVAVIDNGSGIEARALPHVFERFYRAEHRHAGSEHAGLGLAIAKRIVELHGSSIQVYSHPGRGSVFAFVLRSAAAG